MILFQNALLSNNKIRDILVQNGTIIKIDSNISTSIHHTFDCEGRLLLSGMIDLHVHFRDPGFPHKETALTGTKAALRGGVTSILDMPNTLPICTNPKVLSEKKQIYIQNSYTNFGFYFGGDARDNSNNFPLATDYIALKIFLNESTGHMLVTDDHILDRLFSTSKYIAVHAEGDAVDKALYFAKKHSNTLYLCHISQAEELNLIKKAKNQNIPIFAEVCPHHILFNSSEETDLLMMKPRLRTARDQKALLEALDNGLIDTWGTDHAPHLIEEKQAQITYGIPSIEFSLEILLTLAKEMNWNYEKVESLYSRKAQDIFKIQNKGLIQENYDADFVLIDTETSYTITNSDIISQCNWSPYIGHTMKSKIHSTYIGGEQVYSANTQEFKKSNYIKELSYDR